MIARGCAMRLGFSRDASGERSILAWASLRAQARPREATTHGPPQAPAQRPTHPKAAAGPSRSEPWRRTNLSLAHRAKAPILPRASSARAGSVPRSHHPRPTPSASPTTVPPQGGSGTEPKCESGQPIPIIDLNESPCRLFGHRLYNASTVLRDSKPHVETAADRRSFL